MFVRKEETENDFDSLCKYRITHTYV